MKGGTQRESVLSSILEEIRQGNANALTIADALDRLVEKVDDHSERIAVLEAHCEESENRDSGAKTNGKVDIHGNRLAVIESHCADRKCIVDSALTDLKTAVQKLTDTLTDLRVQVAVIGAISGFLGAYLQARMAGAP